MIVRRIIRVGTAAGLCLFCVLLIVCQKGSREGAVRGVQLCLNVLTPSLFPFMAVTQLFVRTGLCLRAGKALQRLAKALFGLSGALAPVILLSLLGGYPVGAEGIASLYRQRVIGEREAKRAALFAVCAGPGFLIRFVGASVYNNQSVGMVLFAAQVLSVLLTGAALGLFREKSGGNKAAGAAATAGGQAPLPFSQALAASTAAAARGMLGVCAFVLLFSSLSGVMAQLIPDGAALDTLMILTEVCGAVTRCSATRTVTAVAFAAGFGGLCVHCQIFAALGEVRVNKALFFLFRIIQGALTALFTRIGLRFLPQTTAVFSTASTKSSGFFGGSVLSGAVLLGVMVCFFISVKQTYRQ